MHFRNRTPYLPKRLGNWQTSSDKGSEKEALLWLTSNCGQNFVEGSLEIGT